MIEENVKIKILSIINDITSESQEWAKQALVCLRCQKMGIKLKEHGGTKKVFSELSNYVETNLDSDGLPILKLKKKDSFVNNLITENTEIKAKDDKKGLCSLGYIRNLTQKNGLNSCVDFLSKLIEQNITLQEIDTYIEYDKIVYLDFNGNPTSENKAVVKRVYLSIKDKYNGYIYGEFNRENTTNDFVGIYWYSTSILSFEKYGKINSKSIENLKQISHNKDITESNIFSYVTGVEYLNGGGYSKSREGCKISLKDSKFCRFKTSLKTQSDEPILIWLTKDSKGFYEGIDCGNEADFKQSLSNRKRYFSGRMSFNSEDDCNMFLKELAEVSMNEPWAYNTKKESKIDYPILKSYLEYELERLFYEYEDLKRNNKIIFNNTNDKIWFNTNLLDKFAHDLTIVGDVIVIGGKQCITNLQKNPSLKNLRRLGFDNTAPLPPNFFDDINEIVFHCEWDIDSNLSKYEHIIESRIERFPKEYQELTPSSLSTKLDNAIKFAQNIAQRNYKFIVPMYYPKHHRIQLLMPVYLETLCTNQPDFALVLTPDSKNKLYTPETILGLEEVYQDARLIAKPDESWLNPNLIK